MELIRHEIETRLVYGVEPFTYGGYEVDRIVIRTVAWLHDPDDEPFFDVDAKGWKLNAKGERDKRSNDRHLFFVPPSHPVVAEVVAKAKALLGVTV